MEISFKNNKLKRSFSDDTQFLRTYGKLAFKIKERYVDLQAAENLWVISKIPTLRLHQHLGNKGIWSIDIIKNWRILFTINESIIPKLKDGSIDLKNVQKIKINSIEDPH